MSMEMHFTWTKGTAARDADVTDVSIFHNGPNFYKPSLSFWWLNFSNGRLGASHSHSDSDSGLASETTQILFP